MSSNALEAQGLILKIGNAASPEVFTEIQEVRSINGPGGSAAVIDVTDLSSLAREKRMGIADEGQLSFEMMYIPSDTQHALLRTQRANRTETNFQLDFTDSPVTTWSFAGFITTFTISAQVDGVVMANVTIEITGAITES